MKKETNLKFVRKEMEKLFAHNRKKSFNYKQIAASLGSESTEAKDHIIRTLKALEKEGYIEEVMPGKYLAVFVNEFITGRLELTQRGAGFVIPQVEEKAEKAEKVEKAERDDIYISSENLNTALHGDTVKVNLFSKKNGNHREGEVVEVTERKKSEFVGVLEMGHNFAFVSPDDRHMKTDIFIPAGKAGQSKNAGEDP
ncbi:MAG: hypothetical protein V4658_07205 [Bacteroidota bacterium]